MAEALSTRVTEAEERRELERLVPPLTRPREKGVVYGGRFALAYLIVVLVFGGVAAGFAYMLSRPDDTKWAAFEPTGEGLARASQIANYVSPRYRVDGEQVAVVEAQPPIVENRVIDAIAIARERIQSVGGGYRSFERADRTLFYVFCGLGRSCSLRSQSTEQIPLLQQEALELALYTFKHMKEIDAVVALLPPASQTAAVYLRRRALEPQLSEPLRRTLTGGAPFTPANMPDKDRVLGLTDHRTFPAYFQPAANGGVMLRLGGPPPSNTQGGNGGQSQTQSQTP